MKAELNDIYQAFDGKLVGTFSMKRYVCEILVKMPENIIDFVTKNCWFVSSMEDAWAFVLTGNELKDQHLIFLSEHLLMQHKSQIKHSIAHEIGHVVLGHRNSVLVKQTKEEIRRQEKEAEEFAEEHEV